MIAAAVMISVLGGTVRAGLMPFSSARAATRQGASVAVPSEILAAATPKPFLALPTASDLASAGFGPLLDAASAEAAEPASVQVLADRSNSLDLCLYALVGLGVLRSGHWIRKPSLGFIPEWYHAGGPYQVGHSHATGPDACCRAAICLVQPACRPQGLLAPYRRATLAPLLRKSQSTPAVLAPRGPPALATSDSVGA